MVQVRWQQRSFVVHLPDLLDACRVEDVGEIAGMTIQFQRSYRLVSNQFIASSRVENISIIAPPF